MGTKGKYISLFARLGERLGAFGRDDASKEAVASAVRENPWFSREDIVFSVGAIRNGMLQPDILQRWLGGYEIDYTRPKRIAVIMAGNIPLVGFFDLMCVVACGHECLVKPSSKDGALIGYICGLLRDIDPGVKIRPYTGQEHCDAVIATGSDNTNRYFRARFAGTPSLLRGSRASAAVLRGNETDRQLKGLSEDIFRYNGTGCRSVSLIFVPSGYDTGDFTARISPANANPKYRNNYLQARALLSVQGTDFIEGNGFVMHEGRSFPDAPSMIGYTFYDDITEVREWLAANEDRLQVVVSGDKSLFPRHAGFGRAQIPAPWDYPDGRDVIRFFESFA